MRYYVIANDGQKYGPADVSTLNAWIAEGRLLATQTLEEEGTANQVPASVVPGLSFAPTQTQPFAGGQPYQGYYARPDMGIAHVPPAAEKQITTAWVCGALGIFCFCFPLPIIGLVSALQAKALGHPSGQSAVIFNIVVLVLTTVGGLFYVAVALLGMMG